MAATSGNAVDFHVDDQGVVTGVVQDTIPQPKPKKNRKLTDMTDIPYMYTYVNIYMYCLYDLVCKCNAYIKLNDSVQTSGNNHSKKQHICM